MTIIDYAEAVLYNGLGRYRQACEAAQRGRHIRRSSPTRSGRCRTSSRPPRAAISSSSPATRFSGSPGPPAPAEPTGRSGSRRDHVRSSPPTARPRPSTGRRSTASAARVSEGSSPGRTSSTASGCAARLAGWTRASSCGRRAGCSPRWGWKRSPSAPGAS
jgi:hypothetical protein